MSFPRYPKYKASGVEWLGDVPEHWSVRRVGTLFRQVDEPGDDELQILSVSIHDGVSDKELDEKEMDRKVTRSDDRSKYKKVQPGDLVYNMMRAWQGGFGSVAVAGMVSPAYVVARPIYEFATTFVEQLLRTPQAIEQMRRHSQGVTDFRLRLYWDEFRSLNVVLPPQDEQLAIATFLDRETAKIDGLVGEQRRLIELLKEKRQAVISHAVTQGLNPHAPRKPSGIEWLGDVPEHWEELPMKALFAIKHGYAFAGSEFSDSGEYVLMTPGSFHETGGYRARESEKFYTGADISPEYILKEGQLLVAMTEQAPGLLGSALFVPRDAAYLHNQRLGRIHEIRDDRIFEQYLFHVFNSDRIRAEIAVTSTGSKVKHTSPQRILSIHIALPPLTEQQQIAEFINAETTKLDALTAEAERAIDLLQERRTALISAAVTGQIDVREFATREAV
jgi:type I restriction enzyme S subunit